MKTMQEEGFKFGDHVSAPWRESITRLAEARGVSVPQLVHDLLVPVETSRTIHCVSCDQDRVVVGIFPAPNLRPRSEPWGAKIYLRLFTNRYVEMSDQEGNPGYICSVCLAKASGPITLAAEKLMPIVKRITGMDEDTQAAAGGKSFSLMNWIMDLLGETAEVLPMRGVPKALPPGEGPK